MIQLCLDTSGNTFFLSLIRQLPDETKILHQSQIAARSGTEDIFPAFLKAALSAAGLKLAGIDNFYIGLGPGSFTGLRIGNSYLKGITFALCKPLSGVASFVGMAAAAAELSKTDNQEGIVSCHVVRPAGRGEFFMQRISLQGSVPNDLPVIVSAEELQNLCRKHPDQPLVCREDEREELKILRNDSRIIFVENYSAAFCRLDRCFSGTLDDINNSLNSNEIIYTRAVAAKTIIERSKLNDLGLS